jgi:alkylation response protein AidB-like acyl-CoA dehydrogenase
MASVLYAATGAPMLKVFGASRPRPAVLRGGATGGRPPLDVFVPADRTWAYDWTPRAPDAPLSATESARLNAVGLAGFASGVARRALSELIGVASKSRRVVSDGLLSEDANIQFGVGALEGALSAARSHLVGLIEATEDRRAGFERGLELSQACQTLARAAREMVVFAYDSAPTSVVYSRQPLQRCLRDIFTGLKHVSFSPALLTRIGRVRLGLPFGGAAL